MLWVTGQWQQVAGGRGDGEAWRPGWGWRWEPHSIRMVGSGCGCHESPSFRPPWWGVWVWRLLGTRVHTPDVPIF